MPGISTGAAAYTASKPFAYCLHANIHVPVFTNIKTRR